MVTFFSFGYSPVQLTSQVAKDHVGDNILCIDAVFDHQVAERNRTKFGYEPTFLTTRYTTVAKEHHGIEHSLIIVKVATQFANALKSPQMYFYVLRTTHFPETHFRLTA